MLLNKQMFFSVLLAGGARRGYGVPFFVTFISRNGCFAPSAASSSTTLLLASHGHFITGCDAFHVSQLHAKWSVLKTCQIFLENSQIQTAVCFDDGEKLFMCHQFFWRCFSSLKKYFLWNCKEECSKTPLCSQGIRCSTSRLQRAFWAGSAIVMLSAAEERGQQ